MSTVSQSAATAGRGLWRVDPRFVALQGATNAIYLFFPRMVSKYVTSLCGPVGISANLMTAIWGLLSVANSYVIYRAVCGDLFLIPVVVVLYMLVEVLDCSDGELARYHKTASPIGGKLLDGICHKATEYSLLVAFIAAAHGRVPTEVLLALSLVLIAGEAMYSYCFERRLLVIRLHAKQQTYIVPTTPDDVYHAGERWSDFSRRRKFSALFGLIHYKSVYFVIALSQLPDVVFLGGLATLALYKHFAWFKLLVTTLYRPPELASA